MNTRAMLLTVAAATFMALPALAQNDGAGGAAPLRMPMRGGGMMGGGLGMMDANHDGAVTKDEWMAQFDRLDANHDGKITAEEMQSARQVRMERMRSMGQQMQGQGDPGGATGGPPSKEGTDQ